jgi:hypothetical protein
MLFWYARVSSSLAYQMLAVAVGWQIYALTGSPLYLGLVRGEFESGVTAAWFGVVPAAVLGGIGTIVVAVLWMYLFPALRRVDTLDREDG